MTGQSPLDVGIVGGGIAGLSAAIAMKRAGHKVELFEKTTYSNEAGISLAIAPNAERVFRSWGLNLKDIGGVEALQVRRVNGATAKAFWGDPMHDLQERYGAKLYLVRHGDVHKALLKHLNATEGPPAKLTLGAEIAEVDCERGIVYMPDGSAVEKDLLVISNGLQCRFLKSITGRDCPLIDTGLSFFRYLLPAKEADADPECQALFEGNDDDLCFVHNFGEGKIVSIVTYICEGRQTRSVNVFARRLDDGGAKEDRKATVGRSVLLELARDFHPSIKALLSKASDRGVASYPLIVRDPLEKYVNGKVLIIGDAAHVMKPEHGQGASISIESVGCLEVLFTGIGKEAVASRMQLFEKLRLRRCGPVHTFSNMPFGPDGHHWMVDMIKPFWAENRPLPPPGLRPWTLPYRDFLYGYNVLEESRKALEQEDEQEPEDRLFNVFTPRLEEPKKEITVPEITVPASSLPVSQVAVAQRVEC